MHHEQKRNNSDQEITRFLNGLQLHYVGIATDYSHNVSLHLVGFIL